MNQRERVLKYISENPGKGAPDIFKAIGAKKPRVNFRQLENEGIIFFADNGWRLTRWEDLEEQ